MTKYKSAKYDIAKYDESFYDRMFGYYKTDILLNELSTQKHITIDTLLGMTDSEKHEIIDLLIKDEHTYDMLIDIVIEEIRQGNMSIDTLLELTNTKAIDISTYLKETYTQDEFIDLVLSKTTNKDIDIDLLLELSKSKGNIIDMIIYIGKPGVNVLPSKIDILLNSLGLTKDFMIDLYLEYINNNRHNIIDMIISNSNQNIGNVIDTLVLSKDVNINNILDILILLQLYQAYDTDILIKKDDNLINYSITPIILDRFVQEGFDIDTLLKSFFTRYNVIDIIINNEYSKSMLTDMLSKKHNTELNYQIMASLSSESISKDLLIDLLVSSVKENIIDIDTLLQTTNLTKSFMLDAMIYMTNLTNNSDIDIYLSKTSSLPYNIDYNRYSSRTSTYSIDSRIHAGETYNLNNLIDIKLLRTVWINYAKPTHSSTFSFTNTYKAAK